MRVLLTFQIGGLAHKALAQEISGKVAGVTSKGIFLESSRRIFFLTAANYRSPFNLQLPDLEQVGESIKVGDTWQSKGGSIFLDSPNLRIDFTNVKIWSPEPLKRIDTDPQFQQKRITEFIDRIYNLDPAKGWAFLVTDRPQNSLEAAIIRMTNEFTLSYGKADLEGCLAASRPILGLGGGLTPSGDDWLAGFLLLHARRNQVIGDASDFHAAFEKKLISMAYDRTTSISANRIEAACMGWAEELFIRVADSLFTQQVNITEADMRAIVNFGHSSGVDTCMGIWAGLKTLAGE